MAVNLSPELLATMHESACRILETVGVDVKHSEVLAEIANRTGFSLKKGRICIDRKSIERGNEQTCSHVPPGPTNPRITGWVDDRQGHIYDAKARVLRPIIREDLVKGAKLLAVLADRGIRGSVPGIPSDAPQELIPLEQFMISAEFSPFGGSSNQVCDIAAAEAIYEMNRVYGRKYHQSVWCPSPLILGGSELDILWHMRDRVESAEVGSMPMMGINGPCDPVAVWTLSIAECIGGATILTELLPGVTIGFSPHPQPVDMRSGVMITGSPEWDVLDRMTRDVMAFYGKYDSRKLMLSSASVPNAQAMIEKTASALAGFAEGYRDFGNLGQLACDEVYSPAQLMLDLEILEHAERTVDAPASSLDLGLDLLDEIVAETISESCLFAEHETTAALIRSQYWQPNLLRRETMGQFFAAGSPDLVVQAEHEADRLAAHFQYEAPQALMDELRGIYGRAAIALGVVSS